MEGQMDAPEVGYEEIMNKISKSSFIYRWLLTFLIAACPLKFIMDMFILNLTTTPLPYHCARIMLDNKTTLLVDLNLTEVKNSTPIYNKCHLTQLWNNTGIFEVVPNTTNQIPCNKWVYTPDRTNRESLFMQFDMVCDNSYLVNRFQTFTMFGCFISTLIMPLGDVVGRKKLLLMFMILDVTCSIARVIINNWTMQAILCLLLGSRAVAATLGVPILTELIGSNYRTAHGNLFWVFWGIGGAISSPVAYFLTTWRMQIIVPTVILLPIYITAIFLLPESPRWLLVNGRKRQGVQVIQQMSKITRCHSVSNMIKDTPNDDHSWLQHTNNDCTKSEHKSFIPKDKYCEVKYIVALSVVAMLFFASFLTYFSVSLTRDFFHQNVYINAGILGLLEIPSGFIAWFIGHHIGHKWGAFTMLLISGICLIIMSVWPSSYWYIGKQILAMFIKTMVTVSVFVVYSLSAEVIPTKVIGISFFFVTIVFRIGQIIAPELSDHLLPIHTCLPQTVSGLVSVIGAITVLLLANTFGKIVPYTINDMPPLTTSYLCNKDTKKNESKTLEIQATENLMSSSIEQQKEDDFQDAECLEEI